MSKLEVTLDYTKLNALLSSEINKAVQGYLSDMSYDLELDRALAPVQKAVEKAVAAEVLNRMKDPKFIAKLAAKQINKRFN
jgi:hypothetical protein